MKRRWGWGKGEEEEEEEETRETGRKDSTHSISPAQSLVCFSP